MPATITHEEFVKEVRELRALQKDYERLHTPSLYRRMIAMESAVDRALAAMERKEEQEQAKLA